jgi:hypothetical protein
LKDDSLVQGDVVIRGRGLRRGTGRHPITLDESVPIRPELVRREPVTGWQFLPIRLCRNDRFAEKIWGKILKNKKIHDVTKKYFLYE